MPPDAYLQLAATCISYFVKIAIAYLLCWLLSRLLDSPRQKFAVWLGLIFGSLAYWVYVLQSVLWPAKLSGGGAARAAGMSHQFLLPAKFQQPAIIFGRSLGWAYVAGVLLLVIAGIGKRIRLHLLLRQGIAPSPELQSLFSEMRRHFGVRKCELLVLPNVNSPATVCWWRPRILLPQACDELGDSTVMADVLYHELAHVARRDYFWSSLTDLVCRLLFFHPGVWQARKQMRFHREMACDLAVVVARPEHRIDYAQSLTRVARLCLPREHPMLGIDFAAAPSLLSHRVHAILNAPKQSSRAANVSRAIAGLGLIGGYAFLCSLIALGIAFAPPAAPSSMQGLAQSTQKSASHTTALRSRNKKTQSSATEGEGLISESPAYRLTASNSRGHDSEGVLATSGDATGSDSRNSNIPAWAPQRPGPNSRSAGRTVESVIVATVGTVIGIDRDERKRKDGSSTTH